MSKTAQNTVDRVLTRLAEGAGNRPADNVGKKDEPGKQGVPNSDPSDSNTDVGGASPTDSSFEAQQAALAIGKKAGAKASKGANRPADKSGKFEDDKLPVKEEKEDKPAFLKKDDDKDDDKKEKKEKKDDKCESVATHVNSLFNGENTLSEEFKKKATAIFEAAINDGVSTHKKQLEESYTKKLTEETDKIKVELAAKVQDYLAYVVEEWIKDNEIAIENSIRTEFSEEFITGLKGLFESFYIDVPEGKVDVMEELNKKNVALETQLKEQTEKSIKLFNELSEKNKAEIRSTIAEGLSLTDKEKFNKLAEGIEYKDAETYRSKLEIVKENYFPKATDNNTQKKDINEATHEVNDDSETKVTNPLMSRYVAMLGKKA